MKLTLEVANADHNTPELVIAECSGAIGEGPDFIASLTGVSQPNQSELTRYQICFPSGVKVDTRAEGYLALELNKYEAQRLLDSLITYLSPDGKVVVDEETWNRTKKAAHTATAELLELIDSVK